MPPPFQYTRCTGCGMPLLGGKPHDCIVLKSSVNSKPPLPGSKVTIPEQDKKK